MCTMQLPSQEEYQHALIALKKGGIVAYPTETFYGLAVDPNNEQAIAALYALKQRETSKPLSILIPDKSFLAKLSCQVPHVYKILIKAFWPGPLTLVCSVPDLLHIESPLYQHETLAVRLSSNCVATQLCKFWGGAITATSANISGSPPLLCAEDIRNLLGAKVDYILDGGSTPGGKGSTIVKFSQTTKTVFVLREGVVKTREIVKTLPAYDIICKS